MARTGETSAAATLRALRLNEARWQAVLNSAQDAIISTDVDGIVRLFNSSAEQIFGYKAEEVLGQNVRMLMPAPYRDEHRDYIRRYHETGVRNAIGRIREVEGRRKDGNTFPIELSVSEAWAAGELIFTAIIRDISERKEIEEALRRERDFAEGLIETAQVIVLVLDTEGCIVRFNPYMEEISGYRLVEVQGRDWCSTFLPEADRGRVRRVFSRAVSDVAIRGNINPILTKSGGKREIEWYAKTLKGRDGRVMGVLSVGQDITERVEAELELRDFQRLVQQRERLADIGAITAKIVHDLGNPLAALSLQAQLILRRSQRDSDQPLKSIVKPTEQILFEARRLESLVREFMSFAGEQRLDLATLDLPSFLAQIVDGWRTAARARGITLTLDAPSELRPVRADEEKLHRVFDNLIKNAVEAIDRGPGHVRIAITLPTPEKVSVAVEDTGPGISEKVQVFRLFETTKPHGTGLGLAVAREIVLAHGGDINFARRTPHGTIFRVELLHNGPAV